MPASTLDSTFRQGEYRAEIYRTRDGMWWWQLVHPDPDMYGSEHVMRVSDHFYSTRGGAVATCQQAYRNMRSVLA